MNVIDTSRATFEINSNTKLIYMSAFSNCVNLRSITIPESITGIGSRAFSGCYNLIEIYNKSSLNIIKESFDNGAVGHYALNIYTDTSIPSKIDYRNDGYIFYADGDNIYLLGYNGNDTELTLPENYNGKDYTINRYAFYDCTTLTSITISNGVININDSAFSGCINLKNINMPESLKSIGNSAFYRCLSLTSITIPGGVTNIGSYTFENCGDLESVIIEDGVLCIGDSMFKGCYKLTGVTIGKNVRNIGFGAFMGCEKLTSITIPESVASIGNSSFSGCTSLASITIPDSVIRIGSSAFYNCTSLTDVYFTGTEEVWNAIVIDLDSDSLINATIHFNYVPEG